MNCLRASASRCSPMCGAHGLGRQRLDRRLRELQADHRGRLDRGALGARQLVQPRLEQRLDRRRHRDLAVAVGAHPAAVLAAAARRCRSASTASARRTAGCLRRRRRCAPPRRLRQPGRAEQVGHHLRGRGVAQRAAARGASSAGALAPLRAALPAGRGARWPAAGSARPSARRSTCSSRSRNAGSAQWMSSTSATSGPSRRKPSRNLRAAQ